MGNLRLNLFVSILLCLWECRIDIIHELLVLPFASIAFFLIVIDLILNFVFACRWIMLIGSARSLWPLYDTDGIKCSAQYILMHASQKICNLYNWLNITCFTFPLNKFFLALLHCYTATLLINFWLTKFWLTANTIIPIIKLCISNLLKSRVLRK